MSAQTKSTRCYIEQYTNDRGILSGRLREKHTSRKVDLGHASNSERQHFIQFLNIAELNRDAMPDVFTVEGDSDCILVSGEVDFDAPDEIRYIFNNDLSYLFD